MNSSVAIRASDTRAGAVSGTSATAFGNAICTRRDPTIRILHVLDRLDVGGTEKVVAKLIRGLDCDLFQHSICTLRGTAPVARSWIPGIDVRDAGCEAPGFQFNVLRLARIMKAISPTIVHTRNWGGIEGVLAARYAGVPVVIHSEHGYQLDMSNGLPLRQRVVRHAAYRCASAIFTVSAQLRDYHAVQAWWKASSISVLPNGVDTNKFSPSKQASSRIRLQLGIPQEALLVGYVGRLIALKDVHTLLLALEKIVSEIPELHVVVVGSGPELDRLQAYVAGSTRLNGHVCFTGAREDVADMLKAMDVFVLPSLMEGMSNTLLEAMATGLPVVATDVGGNPEILADSSCGYLFQPGDIFGLTNKLSGLLRNRGMRERFGCEARARAHEVFSLEAMLERYRQFYCDLAIQDGTGRQTGKYVWN